MSSNMEDGSEKIRSLESTLDSAYKEITELQKQIIEKDSNKETRQKLEEQKGQLEKEFEDSQRLWNQERDQLHSRIQDLQDAQGRLETQFVRKEENLKEQFYLFLTENSHFSQNRVMSKVEGMKVDRCIKVGGPGRQYPALPIKMDGPGGEVKSGQSETMTVHF